MKSSRFQRVNYFDGQILSANDLQDAQAYEEQMSALHICSLHQTWGIASGFHARIESSSAKYIIVEPGVAYDRFGRTIVLKRALKILLPNVKIQQQISRYDLVISYNDERSNYKNRYFCVGFPEEQLLWRWVNVSEAITFLQKTDDIKLGIEIPIARFVFQDEIIMLDFRHHIKNQKCPYVVSGEFHGMIPTLEYPWTFDVDTSHAGFSVTPIYFINLLSQPFEKYHKTDLSLLKKNYINIYIYKATKTYFSFHAIFNDFTNHITNHIDYSRLASKNKQIEISVVWFGIEISENCESSGLQLKFEHEGFQYDQ